MKHVFSLFVFFISLNVLSQSNLFYDSWILETLVIDNTTYNMNNPDEKKTNDNGDRIILNFNEPPSTSFNTYVCNSKEGQFSLDEDNLLLTIISTSTTLDSCINLGDSDFENLYFSFFQSSTTYNYDIGCLLSGSACYLTIYLPNGNHAYFWNGQLSTIKNEKIDFSIYPNPVKQKLNIISSKNNIKAKILDLNGKLIQDKLLKNTKSIDVQNLKKGFYFISIEDELGNTQTQKFIKI